MTNFPPSDDPGSDPEQQNPDSFTTEPAPPEPNDTNSFTTEPAPPEPNDTNSFTTEPAPPEPNDTNSFADQPLDSPRESDAAATVDTTTPESIAAIADQIDPAIADDELLAAATTSLHDEADMVNSVPGAAGADDQPDPDFSPPDAGLGSPPPHVHAPPPGHAAPAPVRRLYRSRSDRRLGGVSAGIAEYFRIDPTLVRLATLLAAFTGVGILVYIAAWFIVPRRPDGFVEPPRMEPVANERTMTLAFGIGALALAFGIATGSWAVLALALIGGGVWLMSEHTAVAPGLAGAASGQPAGVSTYQAPTEYEPGYVAPPTYAAYTPPATGFAPAPPATNPSAPVRERKPQRITWLVLSILALLTAVGIAAAAGDWWNVSATRFLGIGVVVIGVGIVAGQIRNGGARGLIPLGILAALALFPVSAVDGLLDDGVGEATYRPTSIAELEDTYEHGIGQMTVDLSRLDFEGRTETIDIDLGIGELIVIVSQDTGGQAVLQATAGEVSHMLPSTNSFMFEDGVNIETGTVVLEGDNGRLDLNISVGLGTAELRSEGN